MHRTYLAVGALLGALAVGLGAFGAHGLKKIATPEMVNAFDTGVRYHIYHCLALLIVGILFEKFPVQWLRWAGSCFIIGIVLFSGSLYTLTLLRSTGQIGLDGIGILTPIGGLFFILGWVFLFLAVRSGKS